MLLVSQPLTGKKRTNEMTARMAYQCTMNISVIHVDVIYVPVCMFERERERLSTRIQSTLFDWNEYFASRSKIELLFFIANTRKKIEKDRRQILIGQK
jgi:hypothetical protein